MSSDRIKVAILGGGPSALTTAWELTNPDQGDKFDVTVYQLGWRLGGKCASGRDRANHCEVQEHGLHVFFGYYDNAFEVLASVYEELAASDRPGKYATIYDALVPTHHVTLTEHIDNEWKPWNLTIPSMPGLPGQQRDHQMWHALITGIELMAHCTSELRKAVKHRSDDDKSVVKPHWWERLTKMVFSDVHATLGGAWALAKDFATELSASTNLTHEHHSRLAELLEAAWHHVEKFWKDDGFESWWHDLETDARHLFIVLDLVRSVSLGALREGFLWDPEKAAAKMDADDFKAWLHAQGAFDVTVQSAPVRALYDLTFAYPDQEKPTQGNLAAGCTVAGLFHMARYHGAFLWKMRAGTGDVVATPLYKGLLRRGVKFEFFSRVTNLTPSLMRDQITSITISKQVQLNVDTYSPLFGCNGLDCWPSEPDYDQIVEGEELKTRHIDLESFWTPWKDTGGEVVLRQRVDFDVAVLGIPVDSLPDICATLIEQKPSWQSMIANVRTVQTQSVQLRFNVDGESMGSLPTGTIVGGNDSSALNASADISEIIDAECWGDAAKPEHLSILAGVLPGPETAPPRQGNEHYPAESLALVRDTTLNFTMTGAPVLWPKIAQADEFQWQALFAPGDATGQERLDAQYFRANIDPDQRYTNSVAGSSKHRLQTDQSHYYNLYLTGDWTDNPGNLGGFESTIMSGRLASRAISGLPKEIARVPKDSRYYKMREPFSKSTAPLFVEYNGMQTFPGPFEFKNVDSWAFFVPGEYAKLQAIVDHLFNVTSGGAVSFVPLTHMMMMTFIDITDASSPFEPSASGAYEREVAFWIMVGRKSPPDSDFIDSIAGFTPFLIINNPLGYLEGRNVWGFMKQCGHVTLPDPEKGQTDFEVDAYGVRPDGDPFKDPWQYRTLLTIKPSTTSGSSTSSEDEPFEGVSGAVDAIKRHLPSHESLILPSFKLAENLFEDFIHRRMPQVFLKQFREIHDSQRACYQAITQADSQVENVRGIALTGSYEMTIQDLFNTAICETLGVPSKVELPFGIHFTMDFTIQNGDVLWKAE